jgi:hypothetical protein
MRCHNPGADPSLVIPRMNALLGAGAAVARPAMTADSTDPCGPTIEVSLTTSADPRPPVGLR